MIPHGSVGRRAGSRSNLRQHDVESHSIRRSCITCFVKLWAECFAIPPRAAFFTSKVAQKQAHACRFARRRNPATQQARQHPPL
jgi:hypothetical protein